MTGKTATYQKIPAMRLTFSVIFLLSAMLPVLSSLLNDSFQLQSTSYIFPRFLISAAVTFLFLSSEWLIIMLLLRGGQIIGLRKWPGWLRMFTELILICFVTFWLLFGFYQLLVQPGTADLSRLTEDVAFREFIGSNLMGVLFLYLFMYALDLYQSAIDQEQESTYLKKQYAEARLQALRNQVNPHFLFNSLSVLSSLVHVNADKSEKFIIQLSRAYQYLLESQSKTIVPLSQELEFLNAYFFLLNIRFENKIKLEIELQVDTNQYCIPPMTLQLLVENAVKHNKMSDLEPLVISVHSLMGYLVISNNINSRQQKEASTGIGLDNIQSRYRLFSRQDVNIRQMSDRFEVSLPLLKCDFHESPDY